MVNATRSATGVMLASLLGGLMLAGGMTHSAVAGETIKFHSQHINVGTKWDPTELGDEPGHISATFAAKGVGLRRVGPPEPPYKGDFWGSGEYRKDGTGNERGFGRFTFADGATFLEEWAGKVAGGHAIGTANYYGGSRPLQRLEGGRKKNRSLLRDRIPFEGDGTNKLPSGPHYNRAHNR